MPSPLLLARSGGLYCRFLVPLDLRQAFGRRYVIRSLGQCPKDEARLIAAALAIELGIAFKAVREEHDVDIDKLLRDLDPLKIRDFGAKKVTVGGVTIEGVRIKSDDDLKRFNAFIAEHRQSVPVAPAHPPEYLVPLSERLHKRYEELVIGETSPKTVEEYLRSAEMLIATCGDKPPVDYTVSDTDAVIEIIKHLPPNIAKRKEFVGMTVAQAVEHNVKAKGRVIEPRTMEKHLDRLRAFFSWCIEQRYHPGPNPFANKRLMGKNKRETATGRAFTSSDLARIFSCRIYGPHLAPHQYWGPLLGLVTGARVNEIAQLYLSDVVTDRGHAGIMIAQLNHGQRLKNGYSVRAIPLHPRLVELGFLDYVADVKAAGFQRLFPMLPYSAVNGFGDALADTFHRGMLRTHVSKVAESSQRKAGRKPAPRAGIDDPAKTFHSFRHYFCSSLYQTAHEVVRINELSGHERPGVFNKVYAPRLDFEPKIRIINDLPVPALNIPAYDRKAGVAYLGKLSRELAAKA